MLDYIIHIHPYGARRNFHWSTRVFGKVILRSARWAKTKLQTPLPTGYQLVNLYRPNKCNLLGLKTVWLEINLWSSLNKRFSIGNIIIISRISILVRIADTKNNLTTDSAGLIVSIIDDRNVWFCNSVQDIDLKTRKQSKAVTWAENRNKQQYAYMRRLKNGFQS